MARMYTPFLTGLVLCLCFLLSSACPTPNPSLESSVNDPIPSIASYYKVTYPQGKQGWMRAAGLLSGLNLERKTNGAIFLVEVAETTSVPSTATSTVRQKVVRVELNAHEKQSLSNVTSNRGRNARYAMMTAHSHSGHTSSGIRQFVATSMLQRYANPVVNSALNWMFTRTGVSRFALPNVATRVSESDVKESIEQSSREGGWPSQLSRDSNGFLFEKKSDAEYVTYVPFV